MKIFVPISKILKDICMHLLDRDPVVGLLIPEVELEYEYVQF